MNRYLLACALAAVLVACATTPDCSPTTGFEIGLAGDEAPAHCSEQAVQESYRLGHELGRMRRERDALRARSESLDAGERARLRSLERDIPELETLARLEGLMAPAEIER